MSTEKVVEEIRYSKDLTRTQLVSMVASLRGELGTLVRLQDAKLITTPSADAEDQHFVEDSFTNARTALELSSFRPSPEDLLPSTDALCDGTFDDSWM